jgi:hypothetical protein
MNLYKRVLRLEVSETVSFEQMTPVDIIGLRVVFTVTESGESYATADIGITNLSDATHSILEGKFIRLVAGYEQRAGVLFTGEVFNAIRERRGADRITRLYCSNSKSNRAKAKISVTLNPNEPVLNAVKNCAAALNVDLLVNAADFEGLPVFGKGYTMLGDPTVEMDKLARAYGFDWSISFNRLTVTTKEGALLGAPVKVSQATGMIGSPEITNTGVNVEVLLNPAFNFNGKIEVESDSPNANFSEAFTQKVQPASGVYKIVDIEHTGDSYGDSWTTKIKGARTIGN